MPGKEDSSVWVAIRPEKMTLHKDAEAPPPVPECPAAHNVAKGEIKDISYLGDISIYHVLLSQWPVDPDLAPQSLALGSGQFRRRREGLGELGGLEPGRASVLTLHE